MGIDGAVREIGGAITKKVKKRSPKKEYKIQEALATETGGAIKKRGVRYYNKHHKYLKEKLTGRGGRLDSTECRKMMYHVMKKLPAEYFQTYIRGRTTRPQRFENDHLTNSRKPRYEDATAHVIDMGGSLSAITHSENGYLRSHDSTFHHTYQEI